MAVMRVQVLRDAACEVWVAVVLKDSALIPEP